MIHLKKLLTSSDPPFFFLPPGPFFQKPPTTPCGRKGGSMAWNYGVCEKGPVIKGCSAALLVHQNPYEL